jgi:cell division protein FtsW (lipid II flippase)
MPRPDAPAQLVWTGIGLAVFVVVLLVVRHSRSLAAYMYTIALAGIVLLMLPAVPGIGSTINGERLWVRLGPVSFQPSELAKICLLVFFASYLVVKREVLSTVNRRLLGIALPRARDLGPVLVAWGASLAVLVVERDLGSSLLFFGLFISVLYIATERTSWLLLGLLLFLVGSWAAYESFAHVRERFEIWLHPFRYYSDQSYQLVQGLFGLASGGLLGSGLGRGHPALVPFSRTDFITAALGEELGVAGLMAVLLLFALLITRSLRAGLGTADPFGTLLAAGIGAALALQVFVVVGGVTALIPLTGLTLPFVSYGGSSLVANFAILALVMRVSDEGRRPPSVPARPAPPRPVDADLPTTSIRLPAAPTSAGGRGRAAGRESA